MPVIQISKIQIRRGDEADLLPDSLSPGEFAMATDSGRIFVGTDPNDNGLWTGRMIAPYDNLEVLTEASVETFARLYDRMHRVTGPVGLTEADLARKPYCQAELPPVEDWTAVMITRVDPGTGLYDEGIVEELTLAQAESVAGEIVYFIFDGDNLFRSGVLQCLHDGNSTVDVGYVSDEAISYYEVPISGAPIAVDALIETSVRFRINRVADGPEEYRIQLEYLNETNTTFALEARVMVAAKRS